MEKSPLKPFRRSVIGHSDSVSILELAHSTYPSTLVLKVHRREASDVGSESGHLLTSNYTISRDSISAIME